MGDRVPLVPVTGLLSPFVDVDLPVAILGVSGTLSRVFLSTLEAPGVGGIVASVRTATGGGGSGIAATIAQGALSGYGTGAVAVDAGDVLYLRLSSAAADSISLGGWFEFDTGVVVVTALTTLAIVKQHAGITSATHDDLLNLLIIGVSTAIEKRIGRAIVLRTITDERHCAAGISSGLLLDEYPVIGTPVVREGTATLATGTDFEMEAVHGLVRRVSGGVARAWLPGVWHIGVDYSGGFASVPADLVLAATKQVRHEFSQTQPSGQDRLGKTGQAIPAGGSQLYVPDGFLPSVIEAVDQYRRIA